MVLGIAAALLCLQAAPQPLGWDVLPLGKLSSEYATAANSKYFPGPSTTEMKSPVRLYKITYRSNDGLADQQASGHLAIPERGAPKGLVVWFQGTTVDRRDAPSTYDGKNPNHPHEAVVVNFCLNGYAVATPDCFGLGDSKGPQPYPLGAVNSQAGIDMLAPAWGAIKRVGGSVGSKLFIAGYSEGGLKAMWMTRRMEELGRPVEASAPMSGPYDLSGTTAQWLIGKTSDVVNLAFKFVAAGLSGAGAQPRIPGMRLEEVFVPSFATYVPFVLGQTLTTEQLGKKFLTKGLQLGALKSTDRIFQPKFRKALGERDTSNPLIKLFMGSDCIDWQPKTKVLLPYLPHDIIVACENTLLAAANMAGSGNVRPIAIVGDQLNHVTAALPAMRMGLAFFDGGFAGVEAVQPTIMGTATYRERVALSPRAELIVRLHEAAGKPKDQAIIATSRTLFGPRQVPIDFSLSYDRNRAMAMMPWAVSAEIRDGGRVRFRTIDPTPVLGRDNIRRVKLLLVPANSN
ncbi:MAG: hypothetical protein HONBIEJF_00268 [Fimbriimonadaceae bacterium]|nr:hypothetical protein [Fimbriimonadaceae bacterium]